MPSKGLSMTKIYVLLLIFNFYGFKCQEFGKNKEKQTFFAYYGTFVNNIIYFYFIIFNYSLYKF